MCSQVGTFLKNGIGGKTALRERSEISRGKSSTVWFRPEKVRGQLVLNRKKELAFVETSREKHKMGPTLQVHILLSGT